MNKRKSSLRGILLLILGISLISYNYFLEKKDYAFNYMSERIYLSENEIPEFQDDKSNVLVYSNIDSDYIENISNARSNIVYQVEKTKDNTNINTGSNNTKTSKETTAVDTQKKNTDKKNNYYIGYLEIPKVDFKRGFVDINSKDNVVSKNISIISGSKYPDVEKGNFIIAGHSGTGIHSYFKNLYKLKIGDKAYVYYNNVKYTYKIVKIYKHPKDGTVAIYRDYDKTTLTLITCTKNDKKTQTVYIAELESKGKY